MTSPISSALPPAAAFGAGPSPWVDGQLPSPWAAPPGGDSAGVRQPQFAQALEQAESVVAQAAVARPGRIGSASSDFGMAEVVSLAKRMSAADAEFSRRVQGLANLDPKSPGLQAELIGVAMETYKSDVEKTIATKFIGKITESLNTLLKTG